MFLKRITKWLFIITVITTSHSILAEPTQTEGSISRSLFTSAVQDHEPIDKLTVLSELISEAFFFTEFRNYQGHTLSHQWSHNGIISHTIPFAVNGKRWRVHSSKSFRTGAKQEGTWVVKVLDEDGTVLSENSIDYIRPSTQAEIDAAQKAIEAKAIKQDEDQESSATDNAGNNPADEGDTTSSAAPSMDDTNTDKPSNETEQATTTKDNSGDSSTKEEISKDTENAVETTQKPDKPSGEETADQKEKSETITGSKTDNKQAEDKQDEKNPDEKSETNTDSKQDTTKQEEKSDDTDATNSDQTEKDTSDKPIWEKL